MHPSAIRRFQGFYGPRTAASVAKIAKSIGSVGGGVFTNHVRAHLLQRLVSAKDRAAVPVSRSKVTATVSVSSPKVTEEVPVSSPKVTEAVPVSSPKVTAAVPVSSPKVTEEVPVSSPKVTAAAPVSSTKVTAEMPVSTTKVTTEETVAVSTQVQQLLDMGFTLPVETLENVLAASNDDVAAALTALVGRE